MTVDEILATGQYTDRRGRAWNYDPDFDIWVEYASREDGILHLGWIVDTKDVRLLIERDLHRGDCPGLRYCESHPVPHVARGWECGFEVWDSGDITDDMPEDFSTLPAAVDAACALAVGE